MADIWRNDFWGTPLNSSGSHGSYRPLCVLTFRLNHWVSGFQPGPFHLVNILLHVLNTALVLRVARLLLPVNSACLAASLFATHPIHTEAVSGIVGRADLLACLFFLLSFICYTFHVKLRDKQFKTTIKFTVKTKMKCCQEMHHHEKCFLMETVHELFGFLRLRSHIFALSLKELPYSSNTARQWICLTFCLGFATAAMLSKETGVTVLLVCAAYDIIRSLRVWPGMLQLVLSLVSLALGLSVLLLLRLYLMGPHTPAFATADNPTARSPWFLTRLLTFLYLPVFNLNLLVFPRWLSFDWSMDAIPRVTSIFDTRNILVIVVYYALYKSGRTAYTRMFTRQSSTESEPYNSATISAKSNFKVKNCSSCKHNLSDQHSIQCRTNNNNNHVSRCDCRPFHQIVKVQHAKPTKKLPEAPRSVNETFLICLVFLVLPFLPASNFLFYVGFVVAERVLYLPSVGYCFLIAFGGHLIAKRSNRRLVRVVFLILLVVLSGRTIRRNRDWRDEESLYRSGIPINPPKAYGNLGSVLSSQGRIEEAERAFNLALHFRPNMADVHYNLGILLQGRGQFEEAILSYNNAIQCRPSLALAHLNLGQLLASRGRCEEAERVFRRCAKLETTGLKDPRLHEDTKMAALLHLGRLHADRGRYQEAVAVYREAVEVAPAYYQFQVLYNLLGESLSRLGMHADAEEWYRAALDAKPDHVPAHITYGKHLARNKTRIPEAEQWFIKAQTLAPLDPSVYQQYGYLLSSQERHAEAAPQHERAAQLAPFNYELVVGAATALRRAGRYGSAEAFYRRAVSLRPHDSSSHSNLGAMLHLSGKLAEAASSYREALRIDPGDLTTLTNLHKLRHLMARLET